MTKRMRFIIVFTMLLVLAVTPLFAFAGSDSANGITLTFPDDMTECNPTFHFSTTGVDPSWQVNYYIYRIEDGTWTQIGSGTTTGELDVSFTPAPLAEGEMEQYGIAVHVLDGPTSIVAKLNGKWSVDCEAPPPPPPPPPGGEGCTPGYWKNHPDAWPFPLDTDFDTTFGRDAFNPDITMDEAVGLRGGQLDALSRHATAAYLNATSPGVAYDLTAAEVVAAFQAAFDSGDYNTTKNMFDELNNSGCPL